MICVYRLERCISINYCARKILILMIKNFKWLPTDLCGNNQQTIYIFNCIDRIKIIFQLRNENSMCLRNIGIALFFGEI